MQRQLCSITRSFQVLYWRTLWHPWSDLKKDIMIYDKSPMPVNDNTGGGWSISHHPTLCSSHLHFQKHDFNITNPYPISMYLWSQHHCCCSFVFLFISFLFFFLMPFATTKEGRKSISMSKSVTYPFIMLPQYIVVLYTLCM